MKDSWPLVLLNGYAATPDDWDPTFVAELERSVTVLRPDYRGASIEEMAPDVLARFDGPAALAGWSMGGFVAQEIARVAPDRVAKLVLLATAPPGAAAVPASKEAWAALIDRSGTPREQATRLIGLLFPPPVAAQIDAQFGEVVAEARAKLDPGVLDQQEQAMRGWSGRPGEPPPFEMPVLAATGSEDQVIRPENVERLGADWVARFAGGGHGFMAQEPQRLAALIAAFLSG